MNGQWLGTFDGGTIIANIDELETNYRGVAYLLEEDNTIPSSVASFSTPSKEKEFQFRTDLIRAIDPTSGTPNSWENVAAKFASGFVFSKYADVKGSWDENTLALSWTTDTGLSGYCALPRSKADSPSELPTLSKDWGAFKQYVSTLRSRQFLFRGQNRPWRMRTSFHRTGRADLARFWDEDLPTLHRHLSARTRHVFDLQKPIEIGAFFNLVQHHGYPTPLLDWTYSPYVAAFFAYRGISNEDAAKADPSEKVRIIVFDQAQWKKDLNQVLVLVSPRLYLSIGEFIAIENERLIPQQAATTVTNVDDVEAYIKSRGSESKVYLCALDLPKHERKQVVRELSYMGITAGSLFPGLDGACEEIKDRNFEV